MITIFVLMISFTCSFFLTKLNNFVGFINLAVEKRFIHMKNLVTALVLLTLSRV